MHELRQQASQRHQQQPRAARRQPSASQTRISPTDQQRHQRLIYLEPEVVEPATQCTIYIMQWIDYHRYRRIGEILMMSRHRYHKNEVLRCFSGLRTRIRSMKQVSQLKSYIPYGSTDELLSSLGHIDATATLKQQSPCQRAIEECKRLNELVARV